MKTLRSSSREKEISGNCTLIDEIIINNSSEFSMLNRRSMSFNFTVRRRGFFCISTINKKFLILIETAFLLMIHITFLLNYKNVEDILNVTQRKRLLNFYVIIKEDVEILIEYKMQIEKNTLYLKKHYNMNNNMINNLQRQ